MLFMAKKSMQKATSIRRGQLQQIQKTARSDPGGFFYIGKIGVTRMISEACPVCRDYFFLDIHL